MPINPWLLHKKTSTPKDFRIYCFSHAGGNGASFLEWQDQLDSRIEVCAIQLPGRGGRFRERPLTSMNMVVERVAEAIGGEPDIPFAFFGHSLGALIAFELARRLRRTALPSPRHLVVSGCDAPSRRLAGGAVHMLPDDHLVQLLSNFGGIPPDILRHKELLALMLPTIRADFTMVDDYRFTEGPPLAMPISVFAGRTDRAVNSTSLSDWAGETTGGVELEWFDGGHFFIDQDRGAVLASLNRKLTASLL
jgi:surfactin synthase thioesterase subunit